LIYRSLDTQGDYSFGKSSQDFLRDADAVAQAVKTRLLLLKGEWWEDVNEGLPLFQNIMGQPGLPENIKAANLIVQNRIRESLNVAAILEFQSSYYNRQYSINCTIITTTGQTASVEVAF